MVFLFGNLHSVQEKKNDSHFTVFELVMHLLTKLCSEFD